MKRSICATLAVTLALASGPANAGVPEQGSSVVLVVPSRYAFVKMAQDLATLRPITVVSYSATNSASLFSWDSKNAKWSPLDAASFASGTGFGVSSHMVVMGTDVSTVNMLATSAKAWATKTTSLPKFDIAKALNAADESLHFSKAEWDWLSERYSLSFKDVNDQRRRYGKYGPPGEHKTAPPRKTAPAPAVDVVLPELVPAPTAAAPAPSAPPADLATPAPITATPAVSAPADVAETPKGEPGK
jgi:hypothetical protein